MDTSIVTDRPITSDTIAHLVGSSLEVQTRPIGEGFMTTVRDGGTFTVVGDYRALNLPHALRVHADALEAAVRYIADGHSLADVAGMVTFFRDFELMATLY